MTDRTGKKWNREETILAFELYCRTPFGKITQSNSEIIELAALLGRTPGSVGLKMHNLAHHDPELQKRNVSAMAHGSKLDLEIFTEFSSNWEELSYQAELIKAKMLNKKIQDSDAVKDIDFEHLPAGEYREQFLKVRIGQYFFRNSILTSYGNKCCITGLKYPELLIASHIKPWKDSDEKTERTNPKNGLCLNAFHDKAFDKGLMTITPSYQIIISRSLADAEMDSATRDWFMNYNKQEICLPDKFLPGKQFLEYHNDVVFRR